MALELNIKKIFITIILLVIVLMGFGMYSLNSPRDGLPLCTYEIPDHIAFGCPNGNETQIVHSFVPNLRSVENALLRNCSIEETNVEYPTFHYEINNCELDLPFNSSYHSSFSYNK